MNFRKIFAVLSCAALVTASSSVFSVTAFAAENVYAKTTADLNLRSGTGMGYGVITVIDENTKVTVLDRSNPDFLTALWDTARQIISISSQTDIQRLM